MSLKKKDFKLQRSILQFIGAESERNMPASVKLFPNWVQLEGGIVTNATIHGIPLAELKDLSKSTVVRVLSERGWRPQFSWYDENGNKNGFLYFGYSPVNASV